MLSVAGRGWILKKRWGNTKDSNENWHLLLLRAVLTATTPQSWDMALPYFFKGDISKTRNTTFDSASKVYSCIPVMPNRAPEFWYLRLFSEISCVCGGGCWAISCQILNVSRTAPKMTSGIYLNFFKCSGRDLPGSSQEIKTEWRGILHLSDWRWRWRWLSHHCSQLLPRYIKPSQMGRAHLAVWSILCCHATSIYNLGRATDFKGFQRWRNCATWRDFGSHRLRVWIQGSRNLQPPGDFWGTQLTFCSQGMPLSTGRKRVGKPTPSLRNLSVYELMRQGYISYVLKSIRWEYL